MQSFSSTSYSSYSSLLNAAMCYVLMNLCACLSTQVADDINNLFLFCINILILIENFSLHSLGDLEISVKYCLFNGPENCYIFSGICPRT